MTEGPRNTELARTGRKDDVRLLAFWEMPFKTTSREIDSAIETGNFALARKLQLEGGFSDHDMAVAAAVEFEKCFDRRRENSVMQFASGISNEFNLPQPVVDERLVFFMAEDMKGLNFDTVFDHYAKYFSITNEMKKEVGKDVIAEMKNLGPRYERHVDVIQKYFERIFPGYTGSL